MFCTPDLFIRFIPAVPLVRIHTPDILDIFWVPGKNRHHWNTIGDLFVSETPTVISFETPRFILESPSFSSKTVRPELFVGNPKLIIENSKLFIGDPQIFIGDHSFLSVDPFYSLHWSCSKDSYPRNLKWGKKSSFLECYWRPPLNWRPHDRLIHPITWPFSNSYKKIREFLKKS